MEWLNEEACDRLMSAIFRTLGEAGVLIQDEDILSRLKALGASTDSQKARMPERLLLRVLEDQKGIAQDIRESDSFPSITEISVGVSVAQYLYDLETRTSRPASLEDFLYVLRFQDVYHPTHGASHSLLLRDQPPEVEALQATRLILEHAHHPGQSYVHYGEQVDFFAQLGEIWFDDRFHFLHSGVFASTPLRFDRRGCGVLKALCRAGLSPGIGSMVVSGASAPVTPAGAVVVGSAEILAGWVILMALGAKPPYGGGVASGSLNMRTGSVSFGSPEAMSQDLGIQELFRRRMGGRVGIAGGANYTDAVHPGMQAAYERWLEAFWICQSSPVRTLPPLGSGLIQSGRTLCLEQFIIDEEVAKMNGWVGKGLSVTAEDVGLTEIIGIGPGLTGNHMMTDHSLRHCREPWQSRLFDAPSSGGWDAGPNEAVILNRAHQIVLDAVRQHVPPQPDPGRVLATREVLDHAREALVGKIL